MECSTLHPSCFCITLICRDTFRTSIQWCIWLQIFQKINLLTFLKESLTPISRDSSFQKSENLIKLRTACFFRVFWKSTRRKIRNAYFCMFQILYWMKSMINVTKLWLSANFRTLTDYLLGLKISLTCWMIQILFSLKTLADWLNS